jgi:hypothetical protein
VASRSMPGVGGICARSRQEAGIISIFANSVRQRDAEKLRLVCDPASNTPPTKLSDVSQASDAYREHHIAQSMARKANFAAGRNCCVLAIGIARLFNQTNETRAYGPLKIDVCPSENRIMGQHRLL